MVKLCYAIPRVAFLHEIYIILYPNNLIVHRMETWELGPQGEGAANPLPHFWVSIRSRKHPKRTKGKIDRAEYGYEFELYMK